MNKVEFCLKVVVSYLKDLYLKKVLNHYNNTHKESRRQ